jgi:hypothetical protein
MKRSFFWGSTSALLSLTITAVPSVDIEGRVKMITTNAAPPVTGIDIFSVSLAERSVPYGSLRYDIPRDSQTDRGNVSYLPDGTVIQRKKGMEVRLRKNGTYTLAFPKHSSASVASVGSVAAASFGVTYCSGKFAPLQLVKGELIWGAEQTCDNMKNRPHWVKVQLTSRSKNGGIFHLNWPWRESKHEYGRVSGIATSDKCDTTTATEYRQEAFAYARDGVRFGPFNDDPVWMLCRFKND